MANKAVELAVNISSDASTDGFDKTAAAALSMGDAVDRATADAAAASHRMTGVADAADSVASGSSQAAGGLGDLGGALALLPGPLGALGTGMELAAPAIMGVTGAADLANLATDKLSLTNIKAAASSAKATVASKVQAVATRALAVAQRVLNAAMRANPIGIIITLLIALGAGLVIAYKKSETFRRIVDKAFSVVKSVAGSALGFLTKTVPATFSKIVSTVSNGMSRFRETVSSALDRVLGFFRDLPGRVVNAVSGLAGRLTDVGRNMIEGLIDGIRDMAGRVIDEVTDVVNGAIGKAKSLLGINSPSRVFRDIGRNTALGYVDGLKREARRAQQATEDLLYVPEPRSLDPHARRLATTASPRVAAAGGTTINLNVTFTGLVTDPNATARQIVKTLNQYARLTGSP